MNTPVPNTPVVPASNSTQPSKDAPINTPVTVTPVSPTASSTQPKDLKNPPDVQPSNNILDANKLGNVPAQAAQPVANYKFDDHAFKAHGQKLRKEMEQYIGMHNHNPFMWIQQNVIPLENRFLQGDRSKELFDAMQSLRSNAPKINHDLDNRDVPKTASPQPANVIQVAGGLQLPKH